MKHFLLDCMIFAILLFAACKKEQVITPIPPALNPTFLIDKWIEKEPEGLTFSGTNHICEFTDDLFLLERAYWTDAISQNDCLNDYTAYFKGAVQVTSDSIKFNGIATNELFEIIEPECERYAIYKEAFAYKLEGENILILNPNQDVYLQIRLEKE